jgi:hypothetical protein
MNSKNNLRVYKLFKNRKQSKGIFLKRKVIKKIISKNNKYFKNIKFQFKRSQLKKEVEERKFQMLSLRQNRK